MAGCSCRGMQPAPQPRILSRPSGLWQHHTWPTGPLAYNTWPLWYPSPWWQGLPTTFFNECEQQPPSAAHDVPIPSGAADDAAPDHREYEEQPPTQRGREQYQQYVHITTPSDQKQWLHDYVHRSGTKDRESLLLHAARDFGFILRDDRNFKSRLGLAEYKYRNGQAKHRGKNPRRPRKDRSTSPWPRYVRVNQQFA